MYGDVLIFSSRELEGCRDGEGSVYCSYTDRNSSGVRRLEQLLSVPWHFMGTLPTPGGISALIHSPQISSDRWWCYHV